MLHNWVELAVVTVLGLITTGVAVLQWWTSRKQVLSQLYDRRLCAYNTTKTFLLDLHKNAPLTDDHLIRAFEMATSDMVFLFGQGTAVDKYVESLTQRAWEIFRDDAEAKCRAKDHQLWILQQYESLPKTFSSYLSIEV